MLEDHADLLADFAELSFFQLCDIDAVNPYLTGSRPFQQIDAADQRGFTSPGKTDNTEDIPIFDSQIDIFAGLDIQVLCRKCFIYSDKFYNFPLPYLK